MSDLLTKKEQKELLKIARDTIVTVFNTGKIPDRQDRFSGSQHGERLLCDY